jgi:tetratricopeptide (TPR) repeat protein
MYNIALVHQQRGDYEKSIEFYTETLRIEKVVLGEKHKDVCMTLFKLGEVNKHAGKTAEALQCFQESLEIERSLSNNPSRVVGRRPHSSSPDPAAMARTLTEIGNIHLANGDVVPMMDAFNEASRLYRSAGLSPHNIVVSGQHAYAIDFSFPEAAPAA